jgi:mannose-6-phosphate isomerase-like protein (cupin superfamily)
MTASLTRIAHSASLLDGEVVEENDFGSMRRITADNLPILNRLSIKRVLLNPGAMRTPHWHANANELTYCVSGTALVSVLDDHSRFSSFVVTAGQMFHVDSGALHHIENVGTDVADFVIAFRNERPETSGSVPPSAPSPTRCWVIPTTCPHPTCRRFGAPPGITSWPPASATRTSRRRRTSTIRTCSTSKASPRD